MSRIQEYVDTLSEEEKEQHKEIIKDCLELDLTLRKNSEKSKEKIKQLAENLEQLEKSLFEVYDHFYKTVENLRQNIDSTRYLQDLEDSEWKIC